MKFIYKPLICFDVCQLSVKLSQASVHDFNTARKVKRQAMLPINLRFIKLEGPVFFLAYCDASFANLPDGSSQGGYIIFYLMKKTMFPQLVGVLRNYQEYIEVH